MVRPKKYKKIITGGSISLTGGGVSTSLVPTDAHHCQILIDVIDDKDAFDPRRHRENGEWVTASVSEVRKLATSTVSLVESEEAMEEAKHIASACRTFMRDFHPGDDPRVLEACIEALRHEVFESVAVLVKILELRSPSRIDLRPFEPNAVQIIQGWMDRN